MVTIDARYCRKTNHLLSMQGFGMQITHNILISRTTRKWQHLLPGIADKLVGFNPCIWNARNAYIGARNKNRDAEMPVPPQPREIFLTP